MAFGSKLLPLLIDQNYNFAVRLINGHRPPLVPEDACANEEAHRPTKERVSKRQ